MTEGTEDRTPHIAQKGPYAVDLEPGITYYHCACGLSAGQPFCDSSHAEHGFAPNMFEVTEAKTYDLCGCKQTKTPPYCDKTHKTL